MPNTLLTFDVEDRRARAAFSRLKREVDQLDREFNTTRSEAREAGEAIDRLGDQSRRTAKEVDQLGDEAQQSGVQLNNLGNTTRRINATWRDTNGQLRDTRGRLVSAGQGADLFANSLGNVRGILTGLGAALAAREIFEFGVSSVRSAGQMEGLLRGLRAIEGSQADQRLRDFTEAGQRYKAITTELGRLQAAQGNVSAQSEYLRNVQNGLATQARTLNTEIAALTDEIDGRTGKSVQGLNRRLREKRQALAETQTQLATNANALRALASANTSTAQSTAQATTNAENFSLTLAKLRANAEDTRNALNISINPQQLVAGFQAALAASNAYYNARIANAQNALAQETVGTEAYNTLQTRIFELGRQRLQAERQITAENQRLLQQLSQERIDAASAASTAEVEGFKAAAQAGQNYTDQLRRQINAIPNISSPDAQYGNAFTSQLRRDFEETERQGRSLLDVMRQIANYAFATDLDARIPDPIVRGAAIDERIAEEARGQQTLTDIRQAAGEQGRQFLNRVLRSEERDVQRSVNARARSYRQFTNLVSNTALDLATGRTQNFESVATAFIQQSLRIVLRAVLENQILKRLDDRLTVSRIANIQKVAAAQQASAVGVGSLNIPGLANLPGLGNLGSALSGGGAALGAASLLFPEQIKNLAGGISDTIGNLLSNVAAAPDRAFGAQQVFLKIGENETREITDLQAELREDARV